MKIFVETERLILREILPSDDEGMFELDSDPDVHTYLNHPVETIEQSREIIKSVRQQNTDFGIGRWAMIEKSTNAFMGWTGLKFVTTPRNNHKDYYDLGYRIIKRFWGRGYATESAIASMDYAFTILPIDTLYAMADVRNLASRNVLTKTGFRFTGTFDDEGHETAWYEIGKYEWLLRKKD
ncbi:MAG: GNAT family N-acetyltransferase [Bacteroidota bacterium]|nr:GNAT family N-acetyltransferase [Bacteroidota bacterium]MDP4237809.1 GNAT family N-acetyltransferase [Bacteroidota bacterium]